MMNKLRFISAFSIGTIYESIIKECLLPGLISHQLPYHIFAKPNLGDWASNFRQRPLYIKEAMLKFPDEDLVWIDADAKIMKYPGLFYHIPESCHIGVFYMLWSEHYGFKEGSLKETIEILDNTSFYKNCPEMFKFVDEWIERSVMQRENHRKILGEMIEEKIDNDLNLFMLPRSYCYLSTKLDGSLPAIPLADPVIVHQQTSRKARKNLYED